MKSIGGFFEFELLSNSYDPKLNLRGFSSGRSAFAKLLLHHQVKKIQVPFYTCDVLLEPLKKLNIEYSFYHINESLLPDFTRGNLNTETPFLVNNYFGLLDTKLAEVGNLANAILDNAQALYSERLGGLGAFNSYRKFLGVPDGAEAWITKGKKLYSEAAPPFDAGNSLEHLFGRITAGPEAFYTAYQKNDSKHVFEDIQAISEVTFRTLKKVNHLKIKKARRNNFSFLQQELGQQNELENGMGAVEVPLCYPFLVKNGKYLRDYLRKKHIYTATYWPNTRIVPPSNSFEAHLNENLVALPIDQRYGLEEMKRIVKEINTF